MTDNPVNIAPVNEGDEDMSDVEMPDLAEEDADIPETKVGDETNITEDGGVKKKVLIAGSGWEQPDKDDKVFVHYTGRLTDGTIFDSSVDRGEPFSFTLGTGQVIKGWDKVVETMKKGEKVEVTLAPEYAYGASGSPPKIPANATLVFEIELLRWESVNDLSADKDGSLMKRIVREGDLDVWDRPKAKDIVTVVLTARIVPPEGADGDVEEKAAPFIDAEEHEFVLQDGWLCPAVKTAVESMKKGERVILKVAPKLGFGSIGRDDVPPDSTLEMDLELKQVKSVKEIDPAHTGAVTKIIHKDGVAYKTPNDHAVVTVSWTGRLEDGTVFDEVKEMEVKMHDDGQWPCEALELAVASMKDTEEAEVVVSDPNFGFGAAGVPGEGNMPAPVPSNAKITYSVTLHSFTNGPENYDLDGAGKLSRAADFKIRGNTLFKAGRLGKARRLYEKVDVILTMDSDMSVDEKSQAKALKASAALNLAAVGLKAGEYKDVIVQCGKVLQRDSSHVKALFRRSEAYAAMGDLLEAENDIKAALLVEPGSRDLLNAQKRLRAQMRTQNKKDAALFGAMFRKVGSMYKDQPDPQVASVPEDEPGPAPLSMGADAINEPVYDGEEVGADAAADKGAAGDDAAMRDASDAENISGNV